MIITGRAWTFGDLVDTDVMFPGFALRLPTFEAVTHLFASVRPGWSELVRPGDVVIGGRSFGIGSARPVASLLRCLGISAVLADGLSSLFQRNCVNDGLYAASAAGISTLCAEGAAVTIDTRAGRATCEQTGESLTFAPLPPFVEAIVDAGGVADVLRRDGYLPALTR
ncbi:MAG: 3-isopropylmalate dehydratase [Acidimicrobiales bacterium]|nr:3-isopropylmalate dehydratase [Acidimicrobiales bacterium]